MSISDIATDVINYARKYRCSLADSISDWEGDGPSGSWGLRPEEKALVAKELRARGYDDLNVR